MPIDYNIGNILYYQEGPGISSGISPPVKDITNRTYCQSISLFRRVIKYSHIPCHRRPVYQLSCLAMQGMGDLEVEPDGGSPGEDDVIAFASKFPGLIEI